MVTHVTCVIPPSIFPQYPPLPLDNVIQLVGQVIHFHILAHLQGMTESVVSPCSMRNMAPWANFMEMVYYALPVT